MSRVSFIVIAIALGISAMLLMRRCADLLDKAEQKVAMLKVDADGQPQQAPFAEEE